MDSNSQTDNELMETVKRHTVGDWVRGYVHEVVEDEVAADDIAEWFLDYMGTATDRGVTPAVRNRLESKMMGESGTLVDLMHDALCCHVDPSETDVDTRRTARRLAKAWLDTDPDLPRSVGPGTTLPPILYENLQEDAREMVGKCLALFQSST